MKLVMFDMDGTLTDSVSSDDNWYVQAIEQTLNLPGIVPDWEAYTHASSTGCLQEIVRHHRGHGPTAEEERAIQQTLLGIMSEMAERHDKRTVEIAGAAGAVQAALGAGYAVAIASGDWELTARHKLTSARIPFEKLPSAYCDVSHVRTEIMQTALVRARAHYDVLEFERIVYVGDGAWDVKACRKLSWPLVGIGRDTRAHRLRTLGVSPVLPHYEPLHHFMSALETAQVPAS